MSLAFLSSSGLDDSNEDDDGGIPEGADSDAEDGDEQRDGNNEHESGFGVGEGDDNPQTPLEAWRQVHKQLIRAVAIAREAVAAKKAQRRFWMEEICANLTEDGNLTQTSVWKRPEQPKKAAATKKVTLAKVKAAPGSRKRKNATTPDTVSGSALKRIKKAMVDGRKTTKSTPTTPGNKKLRLKLPTKKNRSAAEEAAAHATADIEDDEDDDEPVAEVEAHEVHDDEDDEEEDDEDDDDERDESDTDDDAEGEDAEDDDQSSPLRYPRDAQHYSPHDYHQGHWGVHPHGYVHPGYSPQAYPPSYHPHPPPHHGQYGGFYSSAGGLQAGLTTDEFYSTYASPTEGDGEVDARPSHPPLGETGSGSESDGGPTF